MSNKFKKGEIATILTIGTVIFLGAVTLISSVFLKKSQTTQSKAAEVVVRCQDNPVAPPQGYIWKADCNKSCRSNTDCPQNSTDINVRPDTSNWCFGFDGDKKTSDDWRCLQLKFVGSSSGVVATKSPIQQPTQPQTTQPGQTVSPTSIAASPTPTVSVDIIAFCKNYDGNSTECIKTQRCDYYINSYWYVSCEKCIPKGSKSEDYCPGYPGITYGKCCPDPISDMFNSSCTDCKDILKNSCPTGTFLVECQKPTSIPTPTTTKCSQLCADQGHNGTYSSVDKYHAGMYECFTSSDNNKGQNQACTYTFSSPDDYNSQGKKCFCWETWWCNDDSKPSDCTCCNSELPISTLTPTTTPTPTSTPIPETSNTPTPTPIVLDNGNLTVVINNVPQLIGTYSFNICQDERFNIKDCQNVTAYGSSYNDADRTIKVIYPVSWDSNFNFVCWVPESNPNYYQCRPRR